MQDRLLTIGEASRIAGFSRSKMYLLARSGQLPFKQLGSTYHISLSVLCGALGLSTEDKGCDSVGSQTTK